MGSGKSLQAALLAQKYGLVNGARRPPCFCILPCSLPFQEPGELFSFLFLL